MLTRAKLIHDVEQLEYLARAGLRVEKELAQFRDLLANISPSIPATEEISLDRPLPTRSSTGVPPERLVRGALSQELGFCALDQQCAGSTPQVIVIDDFLCKLALERVQRFCLEADVWKDASHGYLGAYVEFGFDAPLLRQIVEEMKQNLPLTLGHRKLKDMWAYKCDQRLHGIGIHADTAAFNANLWVTPDTANELPTSGGMLIWDISAPSEWGHSEYNSNNEETQAQLESYLESSGAKKLVIPYRENRCILFRSDLFHCSDRIQFRPGYVNRRTNITFLFGDRHRT